MKLARCLISRDRPVSDLSRLLNQAEPDFLQLDWFQDQTGEASGEKVSDYKHDGAREVMLQVRAVHKALFLRPQLRVVTNAGGLDVVRSMEALAEFLVEHGSPDMPIAAIRGENLGGHLAEVLPAEIGLDDKKVLSAQVEIGGGPLATALAEGARIVVAGAYDSTAPFLAAAVSAGLCGWDDGQFLGNLAAASQFANVLVEAFEDGRIELDQGASSELTRVRKLGTVKHADLECDYANLVLDPTQRNTELITQVAGKANSKLWNLRLTVSEGYRASVLIETSQDQFARLSDFCRDNLTEEELTIRKFVAAGRMESDGDLLVRLEYQANTREPCQQFVDSLQFWLRRHSSGKIVPPLPSIQLLSKTMCVPLPTERIVLAVDTRPAHEWL